MPRPPLTAQQRADADARARSAVLVGLAVSITKKGYGPATIADIAAAGQISKTTIYDHFGDKEDIFLALYEAANTHLIEVVRQADITAQRLDLSWEQRIEASLRCYLTAMSEGGEVTRCLLVEAPAISSATLRVRRATITHFVELLHHIATHIAAEHPELTVPAPLVITAVVGGLHELMLNALEQATPWDIDTLTDTGTTLLVSSLTAERSSLPTHADRGQGTWT